MSDPGDKGDVLVQLIPEPLPALSTSSQDQELNVTLDEIPTHETENTHHETQQGSPRTEQESSAQGNKTSKCKSNCT